MCEISNRILLGIDVDYAVVKVVDHSENAFVVNVCVIVDDIIEVAKTIKNKFLLLGWEGDKTYSLDIIVPSDYQS